MNLMQIIIKNICLVVFLISCSLSASAQLFINEFMAKNKTGLTDNRGNYSDWIEIYNAGNESIDLAGYYLTDSLGEPGKLKIRKSAPDSTIIKPHGFLVFFADGNPGNGALHLSFKLKKSGEQVALFKKEGQEFVLVDRVIYRLQFKDVSYGRYPDGSSRFVYIQTASPGASNNNATIGKPVIKNKPSRKSAKVD
jgi:hypothetical protein